LRVEINCNFIAITGDGLKEQLEALKQAHAAAQKKGAQDLDALSAELAAAREKASQDAAAHGVPLWEMAKARYQ
jgi:hypothetical protein